MAKQFGQDVIDSLSVLEAVVPALHADLWPKIIELLPRLLIALRSKYAIIRQSAARCLATVCDVITMDGMKFVIENAIPLLGDPLSLPNRQGAAELIYRTFCSRNISSHHSYAPQILCKCWTSKRFLTFSS
jgi:TATA-binding protein-associated factor